jgi:hypothetical protein
MKIFFSPRFEKQLSLQSTQSESHILMLIGNLASLPPEKTLADPRMKKLAHNGDLLMLNVDNLRLFASHTETDGQPALVLLDIQEKCGSPRYLHLLDSDSLKWEVDSLVANTNHVIVDDDKITEIMAGTNADGWWLDDYEIDSISKHDDGTITAEMRFHLTGDQKEDQMYCGTEINGSASVLISPEGVVSYEVTEASKDDVADEETSP